ncbi:MAG: purine-nucleoside phosphorylase [Bacteroidota bacterium]|nr:purine-nucleoside phosphorylase [Bacteroidota bacterium]
MDKIIYSTKYIRTRTPFVPEVGIILGTGLGMLADKIEVHQTFDYQDLPHFEISTVETHQGKLIFGMLAGKKVVAMQGRFHSYEGYNMQQLTFPVRVMKMLGIEKLFVSNISGGLNPNYNLGDIVIIEDHINLQTENPLTGKNFDELGPRFPDMMEPYDLQMVEQGYVIGKDAGYHIHKGIYVSVPGPNLETRAEYKFLRIIGADCVGMSTVPEVIVAAHMGLPVFAASIISDLCYEPKLKKANIKDLLGAAAKGEPKLAYIIEKMLGV